MTTRRDRGPRLVDGPTGLFGWTGQDFNVRKSDSEYGLSFITIGRLNAGTTPRACIVASIAARVTRMVNLSAGRGNFGPS